MTKKTKRKVAGVKSSENGASLRSSDEKTFVSSRVMTDTDFNPDYSPVKKDLRRIGVLAISFFAVLVILSFIL